MKIGISGFAALRDMAAGVRAAPDAVARAGYRAANTVGARVMTKAKREIAATLNLPVSYIGDQVSISKASATRPEVVISVRVRPVRLARFAARQLTRSAKHPLRTKGDASRGIPRTRKQAGVSVKVLRAGSRVRMRGAFLLPLRAGKVDGGNGMGVFLRTGPGRDDIEHKYGPSPDQLFRGWRKQNLEDIQAQLEVAFKSQLRFELTGSRK